MPRARRPPRGTGLLAGGFVLFVAVWIVATVPSGAPDEGSHFVRMVGISEGSLFGDAVPRDTPSDSFKLTGEALHRLNAEAGWYQLGVAVPDPVYRFNIGPLPPAQQGRFAALSFHAHSLPLPYLLPAALSMLGGSGLAKLYLGRVGFALQGLALLAIGWLALAPILRRRPGVVAALALLATPLVVFEFATLSPSGTELAAEVATACLTIRFVTDPRARWLVGAAATGAVGVLSRALGWVLVPTIVALVAVANGCLPLRRVPRRVVALSGAVGVAAIAVALWWRHRYEYSLSPDLSPARMLTTAPRVLTQMALDTTRRLGVHDISPPLVLCVAWLLASAAVGAVLARAAGRRGVLTVAAGAAAWAVITMVTWWLLTPTGFNPQARYFVAVPLATMLTLAWRAGPAVDGVLRNAAPFIGGLVAVTWAAAVVADRAVLRRPRAGEVRPWTPPGTWWTVGALCAAAGAMVVAGTLRVRASRP